MRALARRRLAPALLLSTAFLAAAACGSRSQQTVEVRIGALAIRAELARTPEERTQGLSGRQSLAQNAGMLFVFPQAQQPAFWMKDMRFPLDLIWISAGPGNHHVVDVTEDVPPPTPGTADSALQLYTPAAPIQYVLEVNAGTAARSGVHAGDSVAFEPEVSLDGVR